MTLWFNSNSACETVDGAVVESYLFISPFLTTFFFSHANLKRVHASTVQIAVELHSSCEWRTCSRFLHSNCLAWM